MTHERWSAPEPYDRFMGRWSQVLAEAAMGWLRPRQGGRWLDVGCGTGSVSRAVLAAAAPSTLVGVDPSPGYVDASRERLPDGRARFEVGDATALPLADGTVDHAVSGLVLNFVPDATGAVSEMRRVLAPGGWVTAWVWDYADGMQLLRVFWDAVIAEDPLAAELDEGTRFPVCLEGGLRELFQRSGLTDVRDGAVTISTPFLDFEDYWDPFLGAQGPAAGYASSLAPEPLQQLRARLQSMLPVAADGSIALTAKAWIATGRSPG